MPPSSLCTRTKPRRIFAVDGNLYLHRVFHTVTYETEDKNRAIAWSFLGRVLQDAIAVRAQKIVVVFDGSEIFRYAIYEKYKGERGDNSEVYAALPEVKRVLREACIPVIQRKRFEADDVLCALAHLFSPDHDVVIGARDKDTYQYLKPGVRLYDSAYRVKGELQPRYVTHEDVLTLMGVPAHQALAYQCLVGDGTDGVPSVVGPATAKKGLAKWGTLREFIANDEHLQTKIKALKFNRKLVELRRDSLPEARPDLDFKASPSDRMPAKYHAWASIAAPRSKGLF